MPLPATISVADATPRDWLPSLADVPPEMARLRRWLLWRQVPAEPGKKPSKVPMYVNGRVRQGTLNTPEDMAQWGTLDEALNAARRRGRQKAPGRPGVAGVGFTIVDDSERVTCIDLDGCINPAGAFVGSELQRAIVDVALACGAFIELSPSRRGLHVWGVSTNRYDRRASPIGVEVIAATGFVTLTGEEWSGSVATLLDGARLVDITDVVELAEEVIERERGNKAANDGALRGSAPDSLLRHVTAEQVADLRSALAWMPSDDRDLWVRIGQALYDVWSDDDPDIGHALWLEWSAKSAKHDPEADERTWESFRGERTGYAAVFAVAQNEYDWVNPRKGAVPAEPAPQVVDLAGLIVPHAELLRPVDGPMPHVVEQWVPFNEVTLLAAHGGSGKSYVALSLAIHVALDRPFGPLRTTRTRVLFFSAEDGTEVLRRRVARICRAIGADVAELEGWLYLLDASDIDAALHRERRGESVRETRLLAVLADWVREHGAGLVVIDNASDVFDDEEIKRAPVRAFMRSLRTRLARPGRAVVLIAHVNKATATNPTSAGGEAYSGNTAWHNSARSRLTLLPSKDGKSATIEHAKANLGPRAQPVRLEWRDGVPMPIGSFDDAGAVAAERDRDAADKAVLADLIDDFDRRGERVPTTTRGPYGVHKRLKVDARFPAHVDEDRLLRLLTAMETEGAVRRVTVKVDSKKREVFTRRDCPPIRSEAGRTDLGGQGAGVLP